MSDEPADRSPPAPDGRPAGSSGGLMDLLLGKKPGLERFLLAVVPSVLVFGLASFLLGTAAGAGIAAATLVIVLLASRGLSRR